VLLSEELLKNLCELFSDPDFKMRAHTNWSNGKVIRDDIGVCFENLGSEGKRKWDLLASPPRLSPGLLSLSHSPLGGVWAYSEHCAGIGVDAESRNRVKNEAVARVSKTAEVLSCPEASLLWTGKEAVFKALWPSNNGLLISQIELSKWQRRVENVWQFEGSLGNQPLKGVGAALFIGDLAISCFIRDH
jgi:hypothetical protein